MKKSVMNKAIEIVDSFDNVEEISVWKTKDGNIYLMIYFSENENTKKAKAKLFKYNADKGQFEFRQEKDF